VLNLIQMVIRTAQQHEKPVAVCGEMAGDVELTRMLLGFGLRNFSMHPAQLLEIKERVLRTSLARARPLAAKVLRSADAAKTRELLARLNA
jgi:phosphotransferase system enzyme I (PtsI)